MLLANTTQLIQAKLDSAASTNPVVTVDWEDLTIPGLTPGAFSTALPGTTAVDIVSSPPADTYRTVKHITIYNADTITHVITVIYNDNGTLRTLISQLLVAGQTLEYLDGVGWAVFSSALTLLPTRQVLTTITTPPYNTPPGARQLRIRMVGGGGGAGGSASTGSGGNGNTGGDTSFNSIVAAGGGGGQGGSAGGANSGTGGTGGAGTASFRMKGNAGGPAGNSMGTTGAGGPFGGAPPTGNNAVANSGAGGGGTNLAGTTGSSGGGGGAGEYVELIINAPSATYTYAIGAGALGGTAGPGGLAGGAGGSGVIIVDEFY